MISQVLKGTNFRYKLLGFFFFLGPGLLHVDRLMITNSISLLIRSVQIFYFFLIQSWYVLFLRSSPLFSYMY